MSLQAIVKASSPGGVTPSSFTLDIPALLIAAGLSTLNHEGPYLAMLSWELHKADTTAAGGSFNMQMTWESPAGAASPPAADRVLTELEGSTILDDLGSMQNFKPTYLIRSSPSGLWTVQGILTGGAGNSLVNWQFAAIAIAGADAHPF
jgi:hypothetical protein